MRPDLAVPHTRRTVATLLDQANLPIDRIADQLGHMRKPTGPVPWDTLESSPRLDEEERQPQHRIDGEQLQAFVPGGLSALGDLVRDEDR
jgi:hypothetical protein